jgi:hypothetical protein
MLSGLQTHDPAEPPCASPDAWRKRQQHAPPWLPQLVVQTQGALMRAKPTAGVPEQLAQSRRTPLSRPNSQQRTRVFKHAF